MMGPDDDLVVIYFKIGVRLVPGGGIVIVKFKPSTGLTLLVVVSVVLALVRGDAVRAAHTAN